jgi:type IX secretion system PorP/SprF family membrane protein
MMSAKIKYLKIVLQLVVLTTFCNGLFAQQLPHYSQYLLNDFVINPAIAGKNKTFWDCRSNNRYQWKGITDAPRTYILSAHGPFKNKKMGIGGTLFTDITGPTRRVGLNFSYAYHLKINNEYQLNLGISAGILQYAVDGHKLILQDNTDMVMIAQYKNAIVPDFSAGAYLYSKKLFVSLSMPQFYRSTINIDGTESTGLSKLSPHYYFMSGYTFDINDDIQVEPSMLVKYVSPAPVKVDVSVRGIYKKMVWLGLSYRTKDALSVMLGYLHKNWMMVGYSFDYTTTRLRNYSSGTHEIVLGLRFSQPKSEKEINASQE